MLPTIPTLAGVDCGVTGVGGSSPALATIFGVPALTGYSLDSDREDITVGTTFQVDAARDVIGVRIQPLAAVEGAVAFLYRTVSGTGFGADAELLGVKAFGSLVSGSWNSATFDAPIAVTAYPLGGHLIAAVYLPGGGYSFKSSVFASPVVSADDDGLVATDLSEGPGNGVFVASGIADPLNPPNPLAFNHSGGGTHYGVDVVIR